jgi:hypothetical protein
MRGQCPSAFSKPLRTYQFYEAESIAIYTGFNGRLPGWFPGMSFSLRSWSPYDFEPHASLCPASGTRDLAMRFESKANGTGTLRQFVSKATRPKLPGGLLLSRVAACLVQGRLSAEIDLSRPDRKASATLLSSKFATQSVSEPNSAGRMTSRGLRRRLWTRSSKCAAPATRRGGARWHRG